jgi:hypothetical protein
MGRFLLLCAFLLVLLSMASIMDVTEGRGGVRFPFPSIRFHGVGVSGSNPRSLSGGTWPAFVGSSLLAAAAMLL